MCRRSVLCGARSRSGRGGRGLLSSRRSGSSRLSGSGRGSGSRGFYRSRSGSSRLSGSRRGSGGRGLLSSRRSGSSRLSGSGRGSGSRGFYRSRSGCGSGRCIRNSGRLVGRDHDHLDLPVPFQHSADGPQVLQLPTLLFELDRELHILDLEPLNLLFQLSGLRR
jgi:hypothetical protein